MKIKLKKIESTTRTCMLEMPVEDLRRLYNSGTMPMPRTEDGLYDFKTMDKIYKRIGLPEWYSLHGYG